MKIKTNINITEVLKLIKPYKTLIQDITIILMFVHIFLQTNEINDLTIKYNEILNDNIKNLDYINELLNNQKKEELTIYKNSSIKRDVENTKLILVFLNPLIMLILMKVIGNPDIVLPYVKKFNDYIRKYYESDDSDSDY